MEMGTRRICTLGVGVSLFISVFVAHLLLHVVVDAADIGKHFTRSPQSIVAPPGDRVTFQCETNIPAEQVRWKLNGRFLAANESDIRISGSFLVVKVAKVRERFLQQVGDYQCVAEFGAEALTSLPAQLTIASLSQFPASLQNRSLTIVEGNGVAIPCDPPYSNPPPVIQFWKDGRPLTLSETDTPSSTYSLSDAGILHIFNVSATTDSGIYWCTASNHITTETAVAPFFTRLNITPRSGKGSSGRKPPEFLVKPKSYHVVPKDGNITLDCVAVGNPPPFVTWRKLRSPLAPSARSLSPGSLSLFSVGMEAEGEYVCEAYNGVGEALTSLSTLVLNSPPVILAGPESQVVEEGAPLSLNCGATGLPKPRIYWVFNGAGIEPDGRNVVQGSEGGLSIGRVEKAHAGLWQCFAGNPMGSVYSPAEVRVMPRQSTKMATPLQVLESGRQGQGGDLVYPPSSILKEDLDDEDGPDGEELLPQHHHHHKFHKHGGKRGRKHGGSGGGGNGGGGKGQEMTPPSKPLVNRVSDDSVMVRWTVPPNSGYPIQFFKIQYRDVSKRGSRWMTIDDDIPPHIHSYEVRDLKVGHVYKFRIAAVYSNNDNKSGPTSVKFALTKENSNRRPNHAPIITNALPYNNSAILLKWRHMKPEPGGVDGVFIYYRESTSASEYSKVTVLGYEAESSFYISFLKPGVSYDIKIQSFNRAGASGFSSIIAAKTTGQMSTEKPDIDLISKEKDLILPEDEVPASNDHLYVLLGSLFIGFWVILCISCALCYKCKQRRAEQDAKYPCSSDRDRDHPSLAMDGDKSLSPDFLGGHIHHNSLNGYIPTITSHLDDKETSFVERFNNNRPISPSLLNHANSSTCDLSSFKNGGGGGLVDTTELQLMTKLRKESVVDARNCNSLHRKKNQFNTVHHAPPTNNQNHTNLHHSNHHHNHGGSLRKLPYVSCSSDDLDAGLDTEDTRGSRIFPKEHYKVSRKHNRRKGGLVE